jgi:hypothetical protein
MKGSVRYSGLFYIASITIFCLALIAPLVRDIDYLAHYHFGQSDTKLSRIGLGWNDVNKDGNISPEEVSDAAGNTFKPGEGEAVAVFNFQFDEIQYDDGYAGYSSYSVTGKLRDLPIGPGEIWASADNIKTSCISCTSNLGGTGDFSANIEPITKDKEGYYIKIAFSFKSKSEFKAVDKAQMKASSPIFAIRGPSNPAYKYPPGTVHKITAVFDPSVCISAKSRDAAGNTTGGGQETTHNPRPVKKPILESCGLPPPPKLLCDNPKQRGGIKGVLPECELQWDTGYNNKVCYENSTCRIKASNNLIIKDVEGKDVSKDSKYRDINGKGSLKVFLEPQKGSFDAPPITFIKHSGQISLECDNDNPSYKARTQKTITVSFPPRLLSPWLMTKDGDVWVRTIMGPNDVVDNDCLRESTKASDLSNNNFIIEDEVINYSQLYHRLLPNTDKASGDISISSSSGQGSYPDNRVKANACKAIKTAGQYKPLNDQMHDIRPFDNLVREVNLAINNIDNVLSFPNPDSLSADLSLQRLEDLSGFIKSTYAIKKFSTTELQNESSAILLHNGDLNLSGFNMKSARKTILVNGNVNIDGDIRIENGASININDIPALAIMASGDINISGKTKEIYSSLLSEKNINLCSEYQASVKETVERCSEHLLIKGVVSAQNNIFVNRTKIAVSDKPLVSVSLTPAATIDAGWSDFIRSLIGIDDRHSPRSTQLQMQKSSV